MSKTVWFAASKEIFKMGPYKTQLEAWKMMMGLDGRPVEGTWVWCEEVSDEI